MKNAHVGSAPYVVAEFRTSEDHDTYSVPSGAMSAAGKLLTRKTALNGGRMSTAGATAPGALNDTPPSVDETMEMLLNVACRVDPSQKTKTVPSGPNTTRDPWSYSTLLTINWGSLKVAPPSVEKTNAIGDCTYRPLIG